MKQKQSQRVVVNINQAIKAKRKRRAKKAKARTQLPPIYSPMPQSVIRYYDNPIPQRNITFQPTPVKVPEILGVPAETEYAQPVRVERKPIKVPTPLPETEHVLLREEEPVSFGVEEAPTARDVIDEQPPEPEEQPLERKKKKKEKREIPDEFVPTFTQPALETLPLPTPNPFNFPSPPAEEPDQLQKERKTREPEQEWYKKVKADFATANERQRMYDIRELDLSDKEAKKAYDKRRVNFIQSRGQTTIGFSYATPPEVNLEASGGGVSFIRR